jgi:transposase
LSKPIRRCAASPFVVAVTFVAEIGDLRRFDNPRQLMAFLGLVPSERSTGERVRRAGLTWLATGEPGGC